MKRVASHAYPTSLPPSWTHEPLTPDEIHAFLKAKDIAAYKMPKKLMLVEALPRNPVGKVLKRELRTRLEQSTK
jgi:non-ribosomal peptide synthetase component E (peptide arylation enzyme)